jgi:hypothetical protein
MNQYNEYLKMIKLQNQEGDITEEYENLLSITEQDDAETEQRRKELLLNRFHREYEKLKEQEIEIKSTLAKKLGYANDVDGIEKAMKVYDNHRRG